MIKLVARHKATKVGKRYTHRHDAGGSVNAASNCSGRARDVVHESRLWSAEGRVVDAACSSEDEIVTAEPLHEPVRVEGATGHTRWTDAAFAFPPSRHPSGLKRC